MKQWYMCLWVGQQKARKSRKTGWTAVASILSSAYFPMWSVTSNPRTACPARNRGVSMGRLVLQTRPVLTETRLQLALVVPAQHATHETMKVSVGRPVQYTRPGVTSTQCGAAVAIPTQHAAPDARNVSVGRPAPQIRPGVT